MQELNRLYQSQKFEFLVLYGRRRIGKTTLLQEFMKEKEVISYAAQDANEKMNLDEFSKVIFAYFNFPQATPSFQDWNQLFQFLSEQSLNHKYILVIDEFPYLATQNKSILSILQHIIDHQWKNTQSKLILCGSSMSFMEEEILSEKSPLFGRRTAQMKLEELSVFDMKKMMPKSLNEDITHYYAAIGGTPPIRIPTFFFLRNMDLILP